MWAVAASRAVRPPLQNWGNYIADLLILAEQPTLPSQLVKRTIISPDGVSRWHSFILEERPE